MKYSGASNGANREKAPQKARSSLQQLVLCALFAALTGVFSQIAIPIGPVPINLAMLAVFLSGGVLGAKYGAVSQLVYLGLGLLGAPVFSGFTGGPQIVIGPTGGYIAGYVAAALLTGLLCAKSRPSAVRLAASMTAGMALCYLLGTLWFSFVTHTGLLAALSACVLPFLPGDALKIFVAVLLTPRLRKLMKKI